MKENPTPAAFSFQSHLIRKVSFSQPLLNQETVSIEFEPSGEYKPKEGVYKLMLRFYGNYGEKNEHTLIDLVSEGYFKFDKNIPFEEIPDYFFPNSIAILYPYLRAFVTTFTSVANMKALVLPTLNLNSLSRPLKENTTIIN
jgi:preprotein translocase subunit SecB